METIPVILRQLFIMAVYAQLLGKEYPRAVVLICQSTVLCLVTMPLIAAMAGALIH